MRRMIGFDCQGDRLAGTLDKANGTTGLLIVSGGNEIRSGAYAGQASMAQHFAALGFPVFRYDRRGVGESEGVNRGFESSADDIAAAIAAFRTEAPLVERLVAFGNCDAATSLGLFHHALEIDALQLANPWSVETWCADPDLPPPPAPPPSARAIFHGSKARAPWSISSPARSISKNWRAVWPKPRRKMRHRALQDGWRRHWPLAQRRSTS